MRYLVDTSVLLRWALADSPEHEICTEALDGLLRGGHDPCVCAQALIEFRCVATRPRDVNGFGMAAPDVRARTLELRGTFTCLPELPDMADRWESVVDKHSVIGKPCHDARLVALMLAHGVTHLLTLNPADFARYNEITAVTPQELS
jgi:predicted nucleic acid-binding protein